MSPARTALIETFKKQSEGLEKKFEAHTHKSDWTMPYRLFRPDVAGKLPLVVYLHGSGGQGDDNLKQLGLGNIFGTRVTSAAFPTVAKLPKLAHFYVGQTEIPTDMSVPTGLTGKVVF